MESNYIQIRQNNQVIQFRVDIERRFVYSKYSTDYIHISDSGTSSDLYLAVDDYRNIRIYDNFMKEYVVFEVDDLKQV